MLDLEGFRQHLQQQGFLIIDGGLATELEAQGHDLNHPLWSAKLLRDNPSAIEKAHLDYYLAGADIAITSSYQASLEGFRDHFDMDEAESIGLIKRSVELAQKARETASAEQRDKDRTLLVAGSVGPYGASLADGSEYRGDYRRTKEELQFFHRPRIAALVSAGVDLLAIETMPQLAEIEAVLGMLRDEFPGAIAWVSCTLAEEPGYISDGTCIQQVLRVVNQYPDVVVAIGVNCVPTEGVTEALQLVKRRTKLPLLCYSNSGEVYDAESKTWAVSRSEQKNWTALVKEWHENGATLIGGCCRTGPQHVRDTYRALSEDEGTVASVPS